MAEDGRVRYELRVAESMSPTALSAFPELASTHGEGGTVLVGHVRDQSELHGLLARVRTLGMTVVELRQLPD